MPKLSETLDKMSVAAEKLAEQAEAGMDGGQASATKVVAKVFSGGRVHVKAEMCETCIFRPGNLMQLQPGRLSGMVKGAKKSETAIICHSTLYGQEEQEAVCRGFYDKHPTTTLQVAERLGMIKEV